MCCIVCLYVQANRYSSLVSSCCTLLQGPHYALLRPEFALWRNKASGDGILVFFGGADPTDETTRVLSCIRRIENKCGPQHWIVVVGSSNTRLEAVRKLALSMPDVNLEFKVQVSNMAELMATSMLAIGAGG